MKLLPYVLGWGNCRTLSCPPIPTKLDSLRAMIQFGEICIFIITFYVFQKKWSEGCWPMQSWTLSLQDIKRHRSLNAYDDSCLIKSRWKMQQDVEALLKESENKIFLDLKSRGCKKAHFNRREKQKYSYKFRNILE